MTHGEKKIAKIIEELTIYFFAMGADDIRSGIRLADGWVIIDFQANYNSEYRHRVKKIYDYFNEPKNEGIEDFYWELAGSGDPGESSQLLLVGMMIDKADVEIGEDSVKLKLYKEMNEEFL